ncbi:uncharacterized protein LOC111870817 [Cryptotermes secundus]|uniref:uncharacterized protein LOC111870817 n=1 Tax=Cryptotermes secundus TaxID=105785 RepID=UPI000CD7C0D3|nr:uncharacterized protein LOC111870817 [Cryptotermes secundus]
MDLSAMRVVLIAAAGLCLFILLAACYRWCSLVNRNRASGEDSIISRRTSIAVIGSTPPQTRRSSGSTYSEEVGHDTVLYESVYPLPQQLPPYSMRPPPYKPPPVFPDEPPPSYASIAREERRQQRRVRMAATRMQTRRTTPSTSA